MFLVHQLRELLYVIDNFLLDNKNKKMNDRKSHVLFGMMTLCGSGMSGLCALMLLGS